jgi:hypothetical protein
MLNNNFSYKNVAGKLNNIFNNFNDIITKDVELSKKIQIRNRKTTFIDALLYKFNYSINDKTKEQIAGEINLLNNKNTFINSFNYRENQIPVSTYKNIFTDVSQLYKQLNKIDTEEPIKIAVDGTFNNTNVNSSPLLETSLNMGYYDVTNDIPLDLTFEGNNKKNSELSTLIDYLNKKNITSNCILILDRIYCKYEFIDYLIKNNYKFVVRFRNNCKNFKKIKAVEEIRILKFFEEHQNNVTFDKYTKYINPKNEEVTTDQENQKNNKTSNNKKKRSNVKTNKNLLNKDVNTVLFKNVDITMKYEYTLLTNLNMNDYDDDEIKKIYKERWSVELFFKLLKYNFKFEHLTEHDEKHSSDSYLKLYLVNLTMIYLSKMIEKMYVYNNSFEEDKEIKKTKNNVSKTYIRKINKSLAIKGCYNIIKDMFNGILTSEKLKNICDNFVKYSYVLQGQKKERKSKTPFMKWYVKGHSNRSLLCKIIEAKLTNNTSKLNDNHKVLFNICTIKLNR